jgi:hypothetical protein
MAVILRLWICAVASSKLAWRAEKAQASIQLKYQSSENINPVDTGSIT